MIVNGIESESGPQKVLLSREKTPSSIIYEHVSAGDQQYCKTEPIRILESGGEKHFGKHHQIFIQSAK